MKVGSDGPCKKVGKSVSSVGTRVGLTVGSGGPGNEDGKSVSSVGKEVGRRTPGVGASVLFVPAFTNGIVVMARRKIVEVFMLYLMVE